MIPFLKMHGAGNDFVVLDARKEALPALDWRLLADRNFGIGCDQIVVLEPSRKAAVRMRIINADGSEVNSCGNASRCVGWLLAREGAKNPVTVETAAGIISAEVRGDQVTVDMGPARLEWHEIPLAHEMDTLHPAIAEGELQNPVAVSMGNPHIVFFVPDAQKVPLAALGPKLERHALLPERANIGVAQIVSEHEIILRVWERGSGLTLACGTGACAALVAAHRRGLTGRKAQVRLPGGALTVEWRQDGHVLMTGPAALVFKGQWG